MVRFRPHVERFFEVQLLRFAQHLETGGFGLPFFCAVFLGHEACDDVGGSHGAPVELWRKRTRFFRQTFRRNSKGYVKSCQAQARGMSASDAKKYCKCSLNQLMTYWDSEQAAGLDMQGMAPYEIQRILVTPCMK